MTFADHRFKEIATSILRQGYSDEEFEVRPTWPDGTPAHTKSKFAVITRYDLSKEFPILTIRNTAFKSAIDEILWIWQKKSNDVNKLKSNIWNAWASPENHYHLEWVCSKREKNYTTDICNVKINNVNTYGHEILTTKNGLSYIILETNDKAIVQFIDTGSIREVSLGALRDNVFHDLYERSIQNLGYWGNHKSKDIVDFFGPHMNKYSQMWGNMITRCSYSLQNKPQQDCYEVITISDEFQCAEYFYRWVMEVADKEKLSEYQIDKDFYGAKHYSRETCKLLTPFENTAITLDKWYLFNDELFFGKSALASYLEYNNYEKNLIMKKRKSTIDRTDRVNDKRLDVVVSDYIDRDIIKEIKVNREIDGKLPRFKRNTLYTIKKAYGYQLGVKHIYPEGEFDQVDRVLYDLKNNPSSRRIMTNMFNHEDLHAMGLPPCAYSMTFSVKDGKLNAILNQRSQDFLTANNWNVVQYSILVHMFAQVSNLKVGELVHVIADCHIYDRHEPIVKEIIKLKPMKGPKLEINPDVKNFYDFTVDDFKLIDYERNTKRYNIEVAE